MVTGGFIKLHRSLLDDPVWEDSTPEQRVVFITLVSMANYKENTWVWKGERFTAKRGQLVTSLDKIAKKSGKGVSVKNVRSSIDKFEKFGFLANESAKTGRLITILNYDEFQTEENEWGKEPGKEAANDRQTGGKEVANRAAPIEEVRNKEGEPVPNQDGHN